MGFTLREVLGGGVQRPEPPATREPERECPTGKVGFRTRAEADRVRGLANRNERTAMERFRCGFCEQWHLGHRRGRVL